MSKETVNGGQNQGTDSGNDPGVDIGDGGDRGDGGEAIDAKAIFDAEVAALTGAGDAGRPATQAGPVNPDGSPYEEAGGASGEVQGNNGGRDESDSDEQEGSDTDTGEEDQQAGSEEPGEDEEPVKKQRNDWKKEALESREAIKNLQIQMQNLDQKLTEPQTPVKEEPVENQEVTPAELNLDDLELSQEVKDLLAFTPGLDKLISHIAAKQASVLVDKVESQRKADVTEAETAKESEAKEGQFWTEMDNWFSGEYPDLSLSDIRNSPDFNDWLEYRKNWVDTQLKSVNRYETSGAQKVYDRYISENGLATTSEDNTGSESDAKRLASARSPRVGGRKPPPKKSENTENVFMDEVAKLTANQQQHRRQFV